MSTLIVTDRNCFEGQENRMSKVYHCLSPISKPLKLPLSAVAILLTCGDLLMPFYINDLANGINIIMYALDDRRNKLKDKICVYVGAKGS